MSHSPERTFQERQQQFLAQQQAAQRRYNQLAIWRLVWFVAFAGLTVGLLRSGQDTLAIVAVIVGGAVFLRLMAFHQAVRQQRDFARYLADINADEAGRLHRTYQRPETGAEFTDAAHPYTADLDVFGASSLFRLLNRTHTYGGTHRLASWLQHPADPLTIRARQEAVADLRPALDWRQEFEATARLNEQIGQSPADLLTWANGNVVNPPGQPNVVANNIVNPATTLPAYLNALRWALPATTLVLVLAWANGYVPGWAVVLALLLHGLVLRQTAQLAQAVSEQTYAMSRTLGAYQALFRYVESRSVAAPHLQALQQTLLSQGRPASGAVGQLRQLTDTFNFRRNPYFYLLVGVITLWDVHYVRALSGWRAQHGPQLAGWLDVLAEVEALSSLAGLAYAHPHYVRPNVVETEQRLDARHVVHPLLPPNRAVANSLRMAGAGQTVLITGSNMSGKSTFLRTLGTNVVLALAGSVVAAEGFALSPVRVFTSMRTQDSLEENTSSFYAELKRLQTLIQLANDADDWPVLYFLDEILKGTNSADRHRGAEALIRQLHRTTASGFVSTHDLALGQLATTTADSYVHNYHFQSDVQNGQLLFDYRLRPGVCQSFNAGELMRAIGIEL